MDEKNELPDEQETELETQPIEEKTLKVEDGDYLDKITDTDELRKEAKKLRSQKARAKIKEEAPKEDDAPKEEPKGEFITRKEFVKVNQKQAIAQVTNAKDSDSDTLTALKQDIADNWDEVKGNYVARRGEDSVEDIYEDLIDAYNVFRGRTPKEDGSNPALELQKESRAKGTGGNKPTAKRDIKILRTAKGPETWYGAKK